jgi:putative copper resistance protein D
VIVSGVALAALIPPVLVGHSGSSVASPLATASLVLHVVAITLWTGGLLALCAHVGTSPLRQRGDVVARFSTMALACYIAVAVSGVANVAARVAPAELWENRDYLGLLTAKIALFAVLGGFGWMHRRRFVRRTDQGLSPRFWSLAGVEVLLMVAALGIAVVLSHTAPGMPGH